MEDAEESQCTTASVPNSNLKAQYDGKIVFLQLVNAVPIFSLYSEVYFEMLRSFPNLFLQILISIVKKQGKQRQYSEGMHMQAYRERVTGKLTRSHC